MQHTVLLLDKLMFSNIVLFSRHTAPAVSSIHCFINSLYRNSLFCLAVLHVTKKRARVIYYYSLFCDIDTFFKLNTSCLAFLILAPKDKVAQYPSCFK